MNHKKLLLLTFIPLFLSLFISNVSANSMSINVSDDVFVYTEDPDKNFNYDPAWTYLQVGHHPDIYWRTWLKFSVPSGIIITKAEVRLYSTYCGSSPVVTIHYSADNSWNENTITWNNQPNFGNALDSETMIDDYEWYSWVVTSEVSSGTTVSFVLKTETLEGGTKFRSKEYGSNKPYLYIEYYIESEKKDLNIYTIPDNLGYKLGIPLFASQLLCSSILLLIGLLPVAIITRKKGNSLYIELFVSFCILGICLALGWIPVWIALVFSLLVALLFADKMKGTFGRSE